MDKVKSYCSREVKEYFEHRVEFKMNLYNKLANRFKKLFWSTTTISMICAALVPVMINHDCKEIATILSLAVTILVGFQGIFHPREHWRNYDFVSASIRREEMLFYTKSGEYAKKGDDAFPFFVSRVEDLISKEREETIIMRTTEKDSNQPVINTNNTIKDNF